MDRRKTTYTIQPHGCEIAASGVEDAWRWYKHINRLREASEPAAGDDSDAGPAVTASIWLGSVLIDEKRLHRARSTGGKTRGKS